MNAGLRVQAVVLGGLVLSGWALLASGAQAATPEGVWRDPETHSHHTVVRKGDGFEVVSVVDQDDGEVYKVLRSSWEDGVLKWSYFVPSTGYVVNFVSVKILPNSIDCLWDNLSPEGQRRNGTETLLRIGQAEAGTPEGIWKDPETQSLHTVVADGDGYRVVSVIDDDGEEFKVVRSSWQNGVLKWSYFVGSTGTTVHFTSTRILAKSMECDWSNEWEEDGEVHRRAGTETLLRVGPAPEVTGLSPEGVWRDPETGTLHTVVAEGDGYKVVSAIDDDGEVFKVIKSSWEDGVLSWSVYVPSTRYIVNFTTVRILPDALECRWDNLSPEGRRRNGTETLARVK